MFNRFSAIQIKQTVEAPSLFAAVELPGASGGDEQLHQGVTIHHQPLREQAKQGMARLMKRQVGAIENRNPPPP